MIIFVHGRASDNHACWSNESQHMPVYWPDLVASEPRLDGWDIYLAGYKARDGSGAGISECKDELVAALDGDDGKPLDRGAIVFVAHSLGGILVRKILTEHFERFREQRVFLLLLASPSTGARLPKLIAGPLLTAMGVIRDKRLTKQLTISLDIVRDLDRQFRRLLNPKDDRYLPNLSGVERSESAQMKHLAFLGRVVDPASAERYFHNPAQLADEDHSTICKPSNRHRPVHLLLVSACADILEPGAVQTRKPASLQELIGDLQSRFGLRYERGDGVEPPNSAVYWPVRLREPTPIHAQQSFVAAALTKQGLPVELWLDDLGTQQYTPNFFEQRVKRWFLSVGGLPDQLEVRRLSEELKQSVAMEDAWALTRKWLGNTEQPLKEILRLSKLYEPLTKDAALLNAMLDRRPRRLLTPPLVWLGLRLMSKNRGGLITLGGRDETELWQAWRTLGVDPHLTVGHLYGATLSEMGHGGRRDIHMRSTRLSWHSVSDISSALQAADTADAPPHPGTLPTWCLDQCVFLPQYVDGRHPEAVIDGLVYRMSAEVWNLPVESRRRGLTSELEARLLQ